LTAFTAESFGGPDRFTGEQRDQQRVRENLGVEGLFEAMDGLRSARVLEQARHPGHSSRNENTIALMPQEVATEWPSQQRASVRSQATRTDGRRNQRRLLAAAGQLLSSGKQFSLADVASAAGLSTATAYRHFSSADDVTLAFGAGFFDEIESRAGAEPLEFHPLCRLWVRTVLAWGPAMAHLRSREGLLARRARGDARVGRLLDLIEPVLKRELASRSAGDPPSEELSYLVAVWNALADPREILDQYSTLGWSPARIAGNLERSVKAVIATCA
jgi:AcrR family transcriptional regulator